MRVALTTAILDLGDAVANQRLALGERAGEQPSAIGLEQVMKSSPAGPRRP